MTLGFSTYINGQPTYFVEKIWNGIWDDYTQEYWDFFAKELEHRNVALHKAPANLGKKIHTIRADPKNRWKTGNKIHFVIHNRTPNRFQFAPIAECVSIQEVAIMTGNNGSREECLIYIDNDLFADFSIDAYEAHYDYNKTGAEQLAINEGFSDLSCFVDYFAPGFRGKIIHWTDYLYTAVR